MNASRDSARARNFRARAWLWFEGITVKLGRRGESELRAMCEGCGAVSCWHLWPGRKCCPDCKCVAP